MIPFHAPIICKLLELENDEDPGSSGRKNYQLRFNNIYYICSIILHKPPLIYLTTASYLTHINRVHNIAIF